MNFSIKKLCSNWPVALIVVGALLLLVFFCQRGGHEDLIAEKYGHSLAKIVGKGLTEVAQRGNKNEIIKNIRAFSSEIAAIAIFNSRGEVLASEPKIASRLEKNQDQQCIGCHIDEGEPLRTIILINEEGERIARSFIPLEAIDGGASAFAYLLVDASVSQLYAHGRNSSSIVGLLLLVGGAFFFVKAGKTSSSLTPMNDLTSWIEKINTGAEDIEQELKLPKAWERLYREIKTAVFVGKEAANGDLASLTANLRDRGVKAQTALLQLQEGVQISRGMAEAIMKSVGELDATMETIRSSMNAIATSTSDNSTSLIEMSASIDEVAASSDRLSQHVSATASAVFEMVQSVVEVSDNVEVLGRGTETTASSMAEIDASTRQIEENAREAADLSGRMAEAAREGSQAVQETLSGIHDSHGVILETAKAMDELVDASKAIGGVVKIINEINDKTKLLALNAAIIAAQAGEHGKSFAVVAHEIKNLSDRTAMSTGEISRIIRGIKDRTEVAREAVERGKVSTARGVDLAEGAGRTLERILSTAQVSHDMTREIMRATEEQSRGSQNVMSSMEEVSSMVTYIRQAAQEHKKSGESVSRSTEDMRELTEQVKHATAEQADVSRYLSEAIATIDRNLHELLLAVEKEHEESEKILEYTSRLKERSDEEESEILNVELVMAEMDTQLQEVDSNASDLSN